MEMLAVLIIMAIVTCIGIDAISAYEASSRPERAARECIFAFRYARHLAMTTGKNAKVTFDTTNNAFSVYWMSNGSTWDASPVAQPSAIGQLYTITMSNGSELRGTTISLTPAGTTSFIYNAVGSLDNTTTVTFSYGTKSRTLSVSKVGDPVIN